MIKEARHESEDSRQNHSEDSRQYHPAKGTEASYHVARMARPFAFSAKGFAQKNNIST